MARLKLTEYDAKRLVLGSSYRGFSASASTSLADLSEHFSKENLVVKVDEGIKKRGLQGLVKVNLTPKEVLAALGEWSKSGWSHFLVEPVIEHAQDAELYLSLSRSRSGWDILYSAHGGVDIEKHLDSMNSDLPKALASKVESLLPILNKYHLAFLEMNPVLFRDGELIPLDMAAEIDSAALGLPELQSLALIPVESVGKSASELAVAALDASTPASLKFRLLNPQGRIWMLLSGGGASLVLADEVADLGLGKELANYGEYSGAPSTDDVYAYTKIILRELLASQLPQTSPKALIIAGGVANFTDVVKTFKGIIQALDEQKAALARAHLKVFVRRGGPNEARGLANLRAFLAKAGLLGSVHGHDTPLTTVVTEVKAYL